MLVVLLSCYFQSMNDLTTNVGCHVSLTHVFPVNECFTDNGGCSHTCVNTAGSYHCECPPFYELTAGGMICQDIDECSEGYVKTMCNE